MKSSDPAFQTLFVLWTPGNAKQKWRVRFKDGTITVFTKMLAHEDEAGMRHGLGTVVREMRETAPDRWQVNDETYFELSEIKDVTNVETGDVVFPASATRTRPALVRRVSSAVFNGNYATKAQAGAGAAVVIGLACLVIGVNDAVKWTARKGVAAAVVEVATTREVWESSGRSSTKHFKGYAPDIVYRFSLGGTSYVGTIIEDNPDPAPTRAIALQSIPFRQRDTIKAHYNPKNPNDSVVMRASVPPLLFVLIITPFFFFAAYVAILSERGARSS